MSYQPTTSCTEVLWKSPFFAEPNSRQYTPPMASSIFELSPWDFAATIALGAASLLVAWRSAHILLAGLQLTLVGLCLWALWIVTPSMPIGDFVASEPPLHTNIAPTSTLDNELPGSLSFLLTLEPPLQ